MTHSKFSDVRAQLARKYALAERMATFDGITIDDAFGIINWSLNVYGMTLEEMERTLDEQMG